MMIFMERIDPPQPPVPLLTDDEKLRLKAEATDVDDRWVKNFIDHLGGVVRDVKH
jgi:hypothetical protein